MKVKSLHSSYDLIEFHHYIDDIDGNIVSVLELLIKSTDLEPIEPEFSDIFAIETTNQSYVFSNYTVSEYYTIDDEYIKIICVK